MLAGDRAQLYFRSMKHIIPLALAALAIPALAFGAEQPKSLGTFQKWTAATYGTGSNEACYAFSMAPTPKGSKAPPPMLTVTERPGNPTEISLSQGIKYAKDAKAYVTVGKTKLDFFTQGDMAYALHSDEAAKAFLNGSDAVATSPGPDGKKLTDTFSLKGYSDAYKAIEKACSKSGESSGKTGKSSKKKK